MKTKTIYIAEDGTEFDDEKECQDYERKSSISMANLQKYVHFFDKNGKEIHFDSAMSDFEDAYSSCVYMRIDCTDIIDDFIELCEGIETPWNSNPVSLLWDEDYLPKKTGLYSYDNGYWEYIYSEDVQKLNSMLAAEG